MDNKSRSKIVKDVRMYRLKLALASETDRTRVIIHYVVKK